MSIYLSNGRGTLVIDRKFRGFPRMRLATGTNDREIAARLDATLVQMAEEGRRDVLLALFRRHILPLEVLTYAIEPRKYIPKQPRIQLYLYVMRALPSGNLKVGITSDAQQRERQLGSSWWEEIELLGSRKATLIEEEIAHQRLAPWCIRGEWYRPTPEVIAWIKQNVGVRL